jgi:nucleoid-associated protein YgaU
MPALLTQSEVEALARRAGFTTRAKMAAAIAMCEAPSLVNGVAHSDFAAVGDQQLADDVWGFSYGGMQIRSLRAHKGTGKIRDEDRLLDPLFNMQSARAIVLAAGSFKPWSTYTSGMYKAYLLNDAGEIAFPPPPGSYVVKAGDTLSGIAYKVSHDPEWLKTHPGFTWQQLAGANGLHDPYLIRIGDVLLLPTPTTGPIGA